MTLKDLQQKIGELLEHYNRDLAYDEDERVGAAQLILARPEERVSKEKPASIFITSKGFAAEVNEKEGKAAPTLSSGTTTVTYSFSTSSSIQCCAKGWVGIVDSQGVFHACFPVPGACPTYSGPNRCLVPG